MSSNPEVSEPQTGTCLTHDLGMTHYQTERCEDWTPNPLPTNTSEPNIHNDVHDSTLLRDDQIVDMGNTGNPGKNEDAKLEPKSEIEAILHELRRSVQRDSVSTLSTERAIEEIQALIDKAIVAELKKLTAEYQELYNLSLIHGGAYEDCLSDFAFQEVTSIIERRIRELESGDKDDLAN